jgi:hypothetical protein
MTYFYMTQQNPDMPKAFAWASIGSDFDLPGSKGLVVQLQPQMTDADFIAASKEKSAIISELLGNDG